MDDKALAEKGFATFDIHVREKAVLASPVRLLEDANGDGNDEDRVSRAVALPKV